VFCIAMPRECMCLVLLLTPELVLGRDPTHVQVGHVGGVGTGSLALMRRHPSTDVSGAIDLEIPAAKQAMQHQGSPRHTNQTATSLMQSGHNHSHPLNALKRTVVLMDTSSAAAIAAFQSALLPGQSLVATFSIPVGNESDKTLANKETKDILKAHKTCQDKAWASEKKAKWCKCMEGGTLVAGKVNMADYIKCDAAGTPAEIDPVMTQQMLTQHKTSGCDLTKLSSYCMKHVECLGRSHLVRCKKDAQMLGNCDVECSAAPRMAAPPPALLSALTLLALAAAELLK